MRGGNAHPALNRGTVLYTFNFERVGLEPQKEQIGITALKLGHQIIPPEDLTLCFYKD